MADIRINALATTAASTASDDFIAIDGSANGTRKLDAYSPTFGGNLTVSGTTASIGGAASSWDLNAIQVLKGAIYGAGNETGYYNNANYSGGWKYTASAAASGYLQNGGIHQWYTAGSGTAGNAISFTQQMSLNNSGALSLAGNLTVSGRDLTLGSSESVIFFGTPSANYLYYNGSSLFLRVASVDRITIPASTGNVLIGTTTDGGQKLQVSGSALIYAASNTHLKLDNASDQRYTSIYFNNGGVQKAGLYWDNATGTVFLDSQAGSSSIKLHTSNTLALTLDSSQNATFAGSVIPNSAPSNKWGIDFVSANTSAGSYVTIANDGVYALASGSGMIFVWEDAGAGASQIMCYYGQTAILWQSGENLYSTTVDTANKVNVYYSSGTYKIQNKSGSSKNFFVPTIRLRNSV